MLKRAFLALMFMVLSLVSKAAEPMLPRVPLRADMFILPNQVHVDLRTAVQKAGVDGSVIIRAVISPQGRVRSATVYHSSGHISLDQAALTAVKAAQFKPYMEDGVAVSAMADIPFEFLR